MAGCLHPPKTSSSGDVVFLHGDVELWILEARSLPNMDLTSERMRRCFSIFDGLNCTTSIHREHNSGGGYSTITSDPYVSVCVAGATVAQTRVISNCENPNWDEHFQVPIAHPVSGIEFQVKDNDVLGAELIGVVVVPVQKIMTGKRISGWFPVVGPHGSLMKTSPELHLSVQFIPVSSTVNTDGEGSVPENWAVSAYFPLHKCGKVTLYQDAHVADGFLPEIPLDGGRVFQNNKCWEDICHAILEAHHLVYIIGWSVFHKVKLVREPSKPLPSGGELELGDLLKFKSQEGVRVAMLIWDDKTSHDKFLLKTEGVMQTHDEETRKFFRHSTVHCVLSPRYASQKLSIFKQKVVGTLFTHHQKCVIVDSQASGGKRKITAFVGGLDLCDGRYDTPEHRLFCNLEDIFANDFHNPTFSVGAQSPRQPWHDLHCKVEGPAAYDLLTNFEQRWRKATKWKQRFQKVTHWHDDVLIRLDRMSWILKPSSVDPGDDSDFQAFEEDDSENWHVQVFRSIDSGSVKGFPKLVHEAKAQNLVCGKNLKIDKSIHSAYIKAIRSAKRFIYIENQYFLGSSYYWPSYKNAGADNLVPMELALKIVEKITANERFCVYIVLPMWPEGIPSSAAVQEILYWQGQTMQMMYGLIANALAKVSDSNDGHPQDYLNFYCLGKRECLGETSYSNDQHDTTPLGLVQKFRRFMIYVHSKGMIVDDEYIILGSANINQRSLDGSRDTEIAIGAYQPHHSRAKKQSHPRGQVYGYRMSLWAEHLGLLEDCFSRPQSIECVERVNELAENNWRTYVGEDIRNMKGHLIKYPIKVGKDGRIGALPGYECFPDVGGKVLGAYSSLPDVLTT